MSVIISSGISTSSHSLGTPSTVSNVRHSLPKRTMRHGDAIRQKSSRSIWRLRWWIPLSSEKCQDMEPRGETPRGMPLYQRDSRTIPQSSWHEEEVDELDARDTIWRRADGCDSWAKRYGESTPVNSGTREDVTVLRCSEPLRYKVGGPKRSTPDYAGWDRLG